MERYILDRLYVSSEESGQTSLRGAVQSLNGISPIGNSGRILATLIWPLLDLSDLIAQYNWRSQIDSVVRVDLLRIHMATYSPSMIKTP